VQNGPSVFARLGAASVPDQASLPFGATKKSGSLGVCGGSGILGEQRGGGGGQHSQEPSSLHWFCSAWLLRAWR
jgi:hypothetical protein